MSNLIIYCNFNPKRDIIIKLHKFFQF